MPRDRKSTRLNSSHLGISYAVFCLNDTSPTHIYPLSLHDALPISAQASSPDARCRDSPPARRASASEAAPPAPAPASLAGARRPTAPVPGGRRSQPSLLAPLHAARSEEHTSELQSLRHLVCRLLLE